MKKAIACLLALPLMLAACGVQGAPEEQSAQIPSPTPTTVVPATSMPASLSESTSPQEKSEAAASENTVQDPDLAAYTQTLGCFFHAPLQSTEDIPLDYTLAFYLLYQTFERNGESASYTQNDRYFWEIPESDLLQTAELYLGLSDFSVSDITEWPFGKPQNGICYYSQESSLPYGDITVTEVTFDAAASEALVTAEVGDNQFEDSSQQSSTLIYHFACTETPDKEMVYRLEAITAP